MPRKSRLANPNNLRKALTKAYGEPEYMNLEARWDEDSDTDETNETLIRHAITDHQIDRVLALAKPLYDVINGDAAFPTQRCIVDLTSEYSIILRLSLSLKFNCLFAISADPREIHEDLGDAGWLMTNDHWLDIISGPSYNFRPVEKGLNRLHAESWSCEPPSDFMAGVNAFKKKSAPSAEAVSAKQREEKADGFSLLHYAH